MNGGQGQREEEKGCREEGQSSGSLGLIPLAHMHLAPTRRRRERLMLGAQQCARQARPCSAGAQPSGETEEDGTLLPGSRV